MIETIRAIVDGARSENRDVLLEPEALQILQAAGIPTPHHVFVRDGATAATLDLSTFPGDQVVVKIVAPDVAHKSDLGGVVVTPKEKDAIHDAISAQQEAFVDHEVRGFLVAEHLPYDPSLGGEILLGARWTDDFGTVVTYGPGGIYADFLSQHFKAGTDVAVAAASGLDRATAERAIHDVAVTELVTGGLRGQAPRIGLASLVDQFLTFAELAESVVPEYLGELEVNPFVIHEGRLLALDVLARCEGRSRHETPERPVHKIENLLRPRSIGIVGVSERLNPGRIILNNLIRDGFDRGHIFIVKPGSESIEGVACYPDIRSLPHKLDLLILAISAAQIPDALTEVVNTEKAESIIVIPGGLEEKAGTEGITAAMRTALERSRVSAWRGPVINGGNSMGIRSVPGGYDTTFIPQYKLPSRDAPTHPIAFISQSGAYAVAKTSKMGFHSRYMISIGNQMDLTIGDYLDHLASDPDLELYAVYAEGFRPLDGLKFIDAARRITSTGRTVVLYKASRTPEGADASAGHTAAVAGDYVVTRELARRAGVVVCETTEDFEDLVKLFTFLPPRKVKGRRLAAISNAGFECVAMGDHLGTLQLADLSQGTIVGVRQLFTKLRLDQVVDVRNPLDLTPIMSDAPYEEVVRRVMEDENVDLGLISCVPLTGALQTLEPGDAHGEDVENAESLARRLIRFKDETSKPWVAAVDGGAMFDRMARLLEDNGIPTFRTVDRALRALNMYVQTSPESPWIKTSHATAGMGPGD